MHKIFAKIFLVCCTIFFFLLEDARAAEYCSPGNYHAGGVSSGACTKCARGEYQDKYNQNSCKKCPKGWSVASVGNATCYKCPAGSYAENEGQTACAKCKGNTFAEGEGNTKCYVCPENNATCDSKGFTCKSGYVKGAHTCLKKTDNPVLTDNVCGEQMMCLSWSGPGSVWTGGGCMLASEQCDKLLKEAKKSQWYSCKKTKLLSTVDNFIECTAENGASWSEDYMKKKGFKYTKMDPPKNIRDNVLVKGVYIPCPTGCNSCSLSGDNVVCDCPSGQYYNSTSCTVCPAGKYASGTGNTSCSSCTGNTYSSAGASSCTAIPANSTVKSDHTGFTCKSGYIPGEWGECYKCPSNCKTCKMSECHGSGRGCTPSAYCDACNAGYYQNGSSCSSCTGNTYSSAGASSCTNIPANSTVKDDHTGFICSAGYYVSEGYCKAVPENATRSQDGKSFDCNTGYFPVHYYGGEFCFPLPENCAEAKADMSREGNAVCTACNPPYHWDDAKSKCVCPKAGWAKCAVSTCSNKGCANGFRPVAYPTECAEGYDLQDNKCLRRFSVIKGGGASAGGEEEKIVLEEDEEIDLKAIMEEKRDEENGKGKGLYQCRITGVDSGWDDGAPYAAIECPCVDKRFSNDMYCGMHAQFIEKVYDPELYICRKTHEGACGFLFMKDTVKMCMPGLHKSKDGTRCSKSEQQ